MTTTLPVPLPARVLLLGSGELGKEVVIALQRYGCTVIACDSYDNALAEALNSIYKAELIYNKARPGYTGPWRDQREVERETSAWVHWYNTSRPHLALGGITPQQAENQHTPTRKKAA